MALIDYNIKLINAQENTVVELGDFNLLIGSSSKKADIQTIKFTMK